MITLYHGSNVTVEMPKILPKLRALDFGCGFYLTSSYAQAERWARLIFKRRQAGQPIVNIYSFDDELSIALNVLQFKDANADWLEFVVNNRKALQVFDYDIVVGPVANDATLPVIDDYMDGRYTQEEAVRRLLPQNLTDQYAFCSEISLGYLTYQGSKIV
ncbi:DUF3990 domain-containing protein [Faucicola atlantae]|uniref:DUF3990 domain-containing protein n=1 Tax=Faucicola atlantae TaxID=34059 RepID=UPI0025AF0B15|nr:DUF3990 domain-containing protein [Moraxella atlantae]